jgi:hypothetical protein
MNHVNRGVGIATLVAVLFVAPLRTGVTSAQQSPPGFPAAGEPPVVTMLSAGAAPRTALRYALETGQSSTMEMGMLMSMAMEMGGMAAPEVQMPLMKFTATLEVTEVAANGDISYRVKFSGNTVEDTPGVDPSIIAAMRGQNLDLTGVESLGTVTSRGLTKSVTFDLDKVSNPQLKQTLGSMSSTIESLSIPLPEEAVGVGARWEVRQRKDQLKSRGAERRAERRRHLRARNARRRRAEERRRAATHRKRPHMDGPDAATGAGRDIERPPGDPLVPLIQGGERRRQVEVHAEPVGERHVRGPRINHRACRATDEVCGQQP